MDTLLSPRKRMQSNSQDSGSGSFSFRPRLSVLYTFPSISLTWQPKGRRGKSVRSHLLQFFSTSSSISLRWFLMSVDSCVSDTFILSNSLWLDKFKKSWRKKRLNVLRLLSLVMCLPVHADEVRVIRTWQCSWESHERKSSLSKSLSLWVIFITSQSICRQEMTLTIMADTSSWRSRTRTTLVSTPSFISVTKITQPYFYNRSCTCFSRIVFQHLHSCTSFVCKRAMKQHEKGRVKKNRKTWFTRWESIYLLYW